MLVFLLLAATAAPEFRVFPPLCGQNQSRGLTFLTYEYKAITVIALSLADGDSSFRYM